MIQLQVFPLKWQSYSRLFQVIKQHKNFAVAWKKSSTGCWCCNAKPRFIRSFLPIFSVCSPKEKKEPLQIKVVQCSRAKQLETDNLRENCSKQCTCKRLQGAKYLPADQETPSDDSLSIIGQVWKTLIDNSSQAEIKEL